jgi:hypothetical protein
MKNRERSLLWLAVIASWTVSISYAQSVSDIKEGEIKLLRHTIDLYIDGIVRAARLSEIKVYPEGIDNEDIPEYLVRTLKKQIKK